MKTVWLILGILAILGVAVLGVLGFSGGNSSKATSYAKDDPTAPKIEIPENSFDFGKIKLDDVVRHDFIIKNTGQNPLEISSISTSCHCTTATLKIPGKNDSPSFGMDSVGGYKGEIPAGTQATLEVIYTPKSHPVTGPITRIVYFKTNDPLQPNGKIEVLANVE